MKKSDKLAKEAADWDSGRITTKGWLSAPERTPCCYRCDRIRKCPECKGAMMWEPLMSSNDKARWSCSKCTHVLEYPEVRMKLRECPFCGGDVEYHHMRPKPTITCESCGIGFSAGLFGEGISDSDVCEMVEKSWNRRNK